RDRDRADIRLRCSDHGRDRGWVSRVRLVGLSADPSRELDRREQEVRTGLDRARRSLLHRLDRAADDVRHVLARVVALSPAATLARGYAVVQQSDGAVIGSARDVAPGTEVTVRLVDGRFDAGVSSVTAVEGEPSP
ncbi:MAG: exodeoxyribonuclease VII large subunit, partial [Actinoallomurus sp.]